MQFGLTLHCAAHFILVWDLYFFYTSIPVKYGKNTSHHDISYLYTNKNSDKNEVSIFTSMQFIFSINLRKLLIVKIFLKK